MTKSKKQMLLIFFFLTVLILTLAVWQAGVWVTLFTVGLPTGLYKLRTLGILPYLDQVIMIIFLGYIVYLVTKLLAT